MAQTPIEVEYIGRRRSITYWEIDPLTQDWYQATWGTFCNDLKLELTVDKPVTGPFAVTVRLLTRQRYDEEDGGYSYSGYLDGQIVWREVAENAPLPSTADWASWNVAATFNMTQGGVTANLQYSEYNYATHNISASQAEVWSTTFYTNSANIQIGFRRRLQNPGNDDFRYFVNSTFGSLSAYSYPGGGNDQGDVPNVQNVALGPATPDGVVYIDRDGTGFQPYTVWIDTGSAWVQVIPYVDTGSAWVQASS